jgi:hypothetical protein
MPERLSLGLEITLKLKPAIAMQRESHWVADGYASTGAEDGASAGAEDSACTDNGANTDADISWCWHWQWQWRPGAGNGDGDGAGLALALALVLALALARCCAKNTADIVALTSATWRERFGISNCFRAMLEVLRCHKMDSFFIMNNVPLAPLRPWLKFVRMMARNNVPERIFLEMGSIVPTVSAEFFFRNLLSLEKITHDIIQNSASTWRQLNCWFIAKFVKLSLQFDLCYVTANNKNPE